MEVVEALQHPVQQISGIFAIFANSLLMYLIIFHSPKSLGAYKYLMMYITTFEILYAILDLTAFPIIYTNGSALFVILNASKSGLSIRLLNILNFLYCGSFGMSMAIFAVHFVFRYLVVKGNTSLTSSKMSTMLIWYLIPMVYGFVWGLICVTTLHPTNDSDEFLKRTYLKNSTERVGDIAYLAAYFYPNNTLNWTPCWGIGTCVFIMTIASLIMLFCGIKTYNRINNLVQQIGASNHLKTLHNQFLAALVIETLVPIFLMQIPAGVCYLSCFLNCSNEVIGAIVTMTISLYPAIDPLPSILIISSYRNAVLQFIANIFSPINCLKDFFTNIIVTVDEGGEEDVL